jgi:hypothetical protein
MEAEDEDEEDGDEEEKEKTLGNRMPLTNLRYVRSLRPSVF